MSGCRCARFRVEWFKPSEKLSVSLGDFAGSINFDQVTVMWLHLQYDPGLVPSLGCLAMLILYIDMVTCDEGMEVFAALGEVFRLPVVPDHGALLALTGHVLPFLPWCELAHWGRDMILQWTTKHNLGRRDVGGGVRSVAVDEKASGKLVIVQVTVWRKVVLNQSFGALDTNFCPLV